jgi:hypothetical protein
MPIDTSPAMGSIPLFAGVSIIVARNGKSRALSLSLSLSLALNSTGHERRYFCPPPARARHRGRRRPLSRYSADFFFSLSLSLLFPFVFSFYVIKTRSRGWREEERASRVHGTTRCHRFCHYRKAPWPAQDCGPPPLSAPCRPRSVPLYRFVPDWIN